MEFPLRHPPAVIQDKAADRKFFQLQLRRLLKRKVFSLLGVKGYDARG